MKTVVFATGIIAILAFGEPPSDYVWTWQNIISLLSFPWLAGYFGYLIGDINSKTNRGRD